MSDEEQIEARAAELFCIEYQSDYSVAVIKEMARVNTTIAHVWGACLDTAARELYPVEKTRGEE